MEILPLLELPQKVAKALYMIVGKHRVEMVVLVVVLEVLERMAPQAVLMVQTVVRAQTVLV